MKFTAYCYLPLRAHRRGGGYLTKTWMVMRLTAFLLLAGMLQVSARGLAQTVTYSAKAAPLAQVLLAIEKQTGYNIFYNDADLAGTNPVTVDLKGVPMADAIREVLAGQGLRFELQGNTVSISRVVAAVAPAAAPPGEVHGRVTDSTGAPLEGVNVRVEGTKRGTVTGANGEFVLKSVPPDAELVFSSVGYEVRIVKLGGRQDIRVEMHIASQSLVDAVVYKGYYTTTERLNTGDVTMVKGETINEQPVTDPILALEGRVPGLYIQQTSGAPGAYSTIRIMGQNSIANGNDPLYIIDGVPFSSVSLSSTSMTGGAIPGPAGSISNVNGGGLSPFNNLNPADIESIEVLKDADATAIYGSRGANGVILITTKKGKAGATRLDMNVYSGSGEVTRMLRLLNTSQYLEMRREAFHNDGLTVPSITTTPTDDNYDIDGWWDTTRYTNWQKVLIGNPANFTNAQASVSGGSPNTQFVVGGGYSKQGTTFIGDFSDQKASARVNLTHASTDQRFHLQMGASYVYDNNDLPSTDFTGSATLAPDAPTLHNGNGTINWALYDGTNTFLNPAAVTLRSSKAASNSLISSLNLSYEMLPGLQLKTALGYNKEEMNQTYLSPATEDPPPYNNPEYSETFFANTSFTTWILEPQLSYRHKMGLGRIEALVGSTFQQNVHNSLTQYAEGFSSDALITDPLAASTIGLAGDYYTLYRYDAIYGRLGYNFEEKYIVNLTARRDGSSRFGPAKQFGNFEAAGIGWIFSKERFFANNFPTLSFGKLRASYGTTGNDQITDYQFLSTYTPSSSTYEGVSGLYPTGPTNPYFAWELVKKLEGGLDLGFFKDRILIAATYYRNRTGNQLVGYILPLVTGFGNVQANLPAEVQNSGVEFSLNTINIKSKDFSWTMSANLTVPSSKLLAFPGINNTPYSNSYIVGKSLFVRQVDHFTGVNPQTGLYSFATKNANGRPSASLDRVVTKPITQRFYGGIQNSFTYKGFQLNIFVQYVNQLGFNYQKSINTAAPGYINQNEPTAVLGRWTAPGDLAAIERFGTTSTVNNLYSYLVSSDRVITDASFLRLKNLALSYALPGVWKDRLHLQNVRIYLQCQNLFTITHYLGLDPETAGLALPPLRMITGGLQVNL
jgi:TonB-dependent starch-binding outer membrane protein SusC